MLDVYESRDIGLFVVLVAKNKAVNLGCRRLISEEENNNTDKRT